MAKPLKDWNKYTNEDLLNLLIKKQNEIERKITGNDLGNKNGMPSQNYLFKRFNTWSLNKILEMADLRTENVQKMPLDEALKNLLQYYNELKRVPTKKDFDEFQWKPFYDYYRRSFGSYERACFLAGLIDKMPLNQQERIDISIKELKLIANKLNKCPTVKEYDSMRIHGLARRTLEKHLNKSWNNICLEHIPQYELNINRNITRDDIKKDIDYVVNKLGKTPSYKEYLTHSINRYSLNAFYTATSLTYNKSLIEFGYNPPGTTTIIKSENELLDDFYRLFKELKRIPYSREIDDCSYCSGYNTYKKYFGSIENVCELLDIDYTKYYRVNGAGKMCYDLNGNICKSIPERNISNFFIINNIEFVDEPRYSELNIDDGRKFDWKIVLGNNTYYVEYFGMYNKNPRGHINKRYSKLTHKKIRDLYKSEVIDKCIFIFPDDLKSNKISDIFSNFTDSKFIEYEPDNIETVSYYSLYTDRDLLDEVLKHCKKNRIIQANELRNQCPSLYNEILLRYNGYYDFLQAFDVDYKYRINYWNKEIVFNIFDYMISKYNKILPRNEAYKINNIDKNIDNVTSAYRKYGYANLKIEYFERCDVIIPDFEKQWLYNVYLKKGSGCRQLDNNASSRSYEILVKHNLI